MKGVFLYVSDVKCEVIARVPTQDRADVLIQAVRDAEGELGSGRAKQVIAVEILPEHDKYVRNKCAKPVEPRQVFPSSMAASQWLGLKSNNVNSKLLEAKAQHRTTCEVRGVVFQELDNYGAE